MPKQKKSHNLRIIGDVHGQLGEYVDLASVSEYSIQVGDLGFEYSYLNKKLDPNFHKVVAGNHDNYTIHEGKFVCQTKHFLGDFGVHQVPGFGDIFFVRGAYSIDKNKGRIIGHDWWPDEELSYDNLESAIELYKQVKPKIVITHDCPISARKAMKSITEQNKTPVALERMLAHHRPNQWYFGHHHRDWIKMIGGTKFVCLGILSSIDLKGTE